MANAGGIEKECIERLLGDFPVDAHWEHEHYFMIGGHGIRVVGQSCDAIELMTRALQHARVTSVGRTELTVEVWSGMHKHFFDWMQKMVGEQVMRLQTDRYRCLYNPGVHGSVPKLSFFDSESERAIFWMPDIDKMPWYEISAPFRTIFHWFFRQHNILLVHGASIGAGDKGVLLVGRGGSGKSSTALAAFARNHMRYVGDDYVLVSMSGQPIAISLYSSAKITEQSLSRFNCFTDTSVRMPSEGEEKVVLFPCESHASVCVSSLPISTIVLPVVANRDHTAWKKMNSAHALLALAPSTVFQLQPEDSMYDSFAALVELVKHVPAYHIELGTDVAEVGEAIETFLTTI